MRSTTTAKNNYRALPIACSWSSEMGLKKLKVLQRQLQFRETSWLLYCIEVQY